MKIRSGFISNSSSSSFVIIGKVPNNIPYEKLNNETAKRVLGYITKLTRNNDNPPVWDGVADVFLTNYISDTSSSDEMFEGAMCYPYLDGGHGGPYSYDGDDDDLKRISENDDWEAIYVRRQDLDPFYGEKMFVREVKELADKYDIADYVLEIKHKDIKPKMKKTTKKSLRPKKK